MRGGGCTGSGKGQGLALGGSSSELRLRIDDLVSSAERPGFQVLHDHPPHEIAVGAIGKVWQPDIPFAHVANAEEFIAFAEPDYVKVVWAVRVLPLGAANARAELELRVDATVEPLGPARCRFISRFRSTCSDDLATRLSFGATFVEPVGFAMDRRMLLGVKERSERAIKVLVGMESGPR